MKFLSYFLVAAGILTGTNPAFAQKNTSEEKTDSLNIFIGTYTQKMGHVNGQAEGILQLEADKKTGDISEPQLAAGIKNPSFVKASRDGRFLFAVSEIGSGDADSGYLYSYKIGPDQKLEEISKISTEAFAPCHIELDQTGRLVFVSNYSGGVAMVYKQKEGRLEKVQRIDLENPAKSHAHSIAVSGNNKNAYIADLGNDKIWIFNLKKDKLEQGKQAFVALEKGAGPRHLSLSKNGRFLYSINELNNTVSVFRIEKNGGLTNLQTISSLPEGFSEKSYGADIHLHPSGKYLYASNRGHNSIVRYEVDQKSGKLSLRDFTSTHGKTPRNFAISPSGDYLYAANQDSGTISIFKINKDGSLQLKGQPKPVATPVKVEFLK